MTNSLDYIICDTKTEVLSSEFDYLTRVSKDKSELTINDVLNILHKDERLEFYNFCEVEFDPYKPQFTLLHAKGGRVYSHIFIEKDMRDGRTVNIIFLAPGIVECAPLLSPDKQLYQSITGGILNDKGKPGDYLTPEAFAVTKTSSDIIGKVSAEIEFDEHNAELRRFCGTIIDKISEKGCLGSPEILYSETSSIGIYPIFPEVLVHTFISAVFILSFFSCDNRISVNLDYSGRSGTGVCLDFSVITNDSLLGRCRYFTDLARCHRELIYPAAVLEILAEAVGYLPVMSVDGGRISMRFKISGNASDSLNFKYSDPYSYIYKYISEFISLSGLSA